MSLKSQVLNEAVAQQAATPQPIIDVLAKLVGVKENTLEAIATAALPLEFVHLRDSGDFYQQECYRAKASQAYLSACVMAAAAIECLLLMLAFLYETEIFASPIFQSRKYQVGKPAVIQLQFHELIQLAVEFDWVPKGLIEHPWRDFLATHRDLLTRLSQVEAERARRLPDDPGHALLRFMQGIRNSIHGGRFVRAGLSPNREDLDKACRLAVMAYEELKETLLVRITRDFGKIKRTRAPKRS